MTDLAPCEDAGGPVTAGDPEELLEYALGVEELRPWTLQ